MVTAPVCGWTDTSSPAARSLRGRRLLRLVLPQLDPRFGLVARVRLGEREAGEVADQQVEVAVAVVVGEVERDVGEVALLQRVQPELAGARLLEPADARQVREVALPLEVLELRVLAARQERAGERRRGRRPRRCRRPGRGARRASRRGRAARTGTRPCSRSQRTPWNGRIVKSSSVSPLVISTSSSPSSSRSTSWMPDEPHTGVDRTEDRLLRGSLGPVPRLKNATTCSYCCATSATKSGPPVAVEVGRPARGSAPAARRS